MRLTRPATSTGNGAAAISLRGRKSMDTSRFLILLGLVICAVGLFWPVISKLGLGRLPGDIVIERDGFSFYFPLTTGLIVSAFVSALLWLLSR
jgi:formate hydrogenlyase subunit 3/multisubunit Na+/H+ antiporter MnhD subunit